jgi:hypothetical protein
MSYCCKKKKPKKTKKLLYYVKLLLSLIFERNDFNFYVLHMWEEFRNLFGEHRNHHSSHSYKVQESLGNRKEENETDQSRIWTQAPRIWNSNASLMNTIYEVYIINKHHTLVYSILHILRLKQSSQFDEFLANQMLYQLSYPTTDNQTTARRSTNWAIRPLAIDPPDHYIWDKMTCI